MLLNDLVKLNGDCIGKSIRPRMYFWIFEQGGWHCFCGLNLGNMKASYRKMVLNMELVRWSVEWDDLNNCLFYNFYLREV